MTMLASQITSLTVVNSIVYSGVNQRKHQSSASLAFVWEIHRGPVNFPHKWPVTRKMFPFDDVIMVTSRHGNNVVITCPCEGNPFVTDRFRHKEPGMRSFHVLSDWNNTLLERRSSYQCFKTIWCSCAVNTCYTLLCRMRLCNGLMTTNLIHRGRDKMVRILEATLIFLFEIVFALLQK